MPYTFLGSQPFTQLLVQRVHPADRESWLSTMEVIVNLPTKKPAASE